LARLMCCGYSCIMKRQGNNFELKIDQAMMLYVLGKIFCLFR